MVNVAFFMLCLLNCAVSSPRAKTCLRRLPSHGVPGSVIFCPREGFNIWSFSPLTPLCSQAVLTNKENEEEAGLPWEGRGSSRVTQQLVTGLEPAFRLPTPISNLLSDPTP